MELRQARIRIGTGAQHGSPVWKDFFTLEVAKAGPVNVAATQPADFILELLDPSGTVIAGGEFGGAGSLAAVG